MQEALVRIDNLLVAICVIDQESTGDIVHKFYDLICRADILCIPGGKGSVKLVLLHKMFDLNVIHLKKFEQR